MPFDAKRYRKNWKAISHEIRFVRAQGKCEKCGVAHGAVGARDRFGDWHDEDDIEGMKSDCGQHYFGQFPKMTKIVLTTAHIGAPHPDGTPGDKHDKMDVRPENLAAWCQKCHLAFDIDEHVVNAARTRIAKRFDKQPNLFDVAALSQILTEVK